MLIYQSLSVVFSAEDWTYSFVHAKQTFLPMSYCPSLHLSVFKINIKYLCLMEEVLKRNYKKIDEGVLKSENILCK